MKKAILIIVCLLMMGGTAFAEEDVCPRLQQLEKEVIFMLGAQAGAFCITRASDQDTKTVVACIREMMKLTIKQREEDK
jgi:hypothetical protein